MDLLIGREAEKKALQDAMDSGETELIALFGRRRVGKTFLIRQYLKNEIVFELVGARNAKLKDQLANFKKALGIAIGNDRIYQMPTSWGDAFSQLSHYLSSKLVAGRAVVFFDEFPWLCSHKSGFLAAFDHWWNSWATKQRALVVVICGSATSWMIQNIMNNKGGLHNRVTRKIRLLPFDLKETELFLCARNILMDRYQILQIYMIMGGVPHYLKELRKGESSAQAINRICFTKDGLLATEFTNLYHSLFDDASRHLAVVRTLAMNNSGLTRNEIIDKAGISSGGTITGLLEELIESGFVMVWQPYEKRSKDTIYKLADEFTHFYLKFINKQRSSASGNWQNICTGQSWKSWSGIAFERVCLKHVAQIKKELGISSIYTEESVWRFQSKGEKGAQIDLVIDRDDFVINLCEIKYSMSEFLIDRSYAEELENKRSVFKSQTKTKKTIFLTCITTFGLKENDYRKRMIQHSITMDTLFT